MYFNVLIMVYIIFIIKKNLFSFQIAKQFMNYQTLIIFQS